MRGHLRGKFYILLSSSLGSACSCHGAFPSVFQAFSLGPFEAGCFDEDTLPLVTAP